MMASLMSSTSNDSDNEIVSVWLHTICVRKPAGHETKNPSEWLVNFIADSRDVR